MATRTARVIPTGTWTVDPAHSSVEFSVKHMGIANVRGRFSDFEGTLEMMEDLAASRVRGSVKVASIDTGEAQCDDHLRSPDFFDVEGFPEITFESTRIEAIDEESSRVFGNLTMHGISTRSSSKWRSRAPTLIRGAIRARASRWSASSSAATGT